VADTDWEIKALLFRAIQRPDNPAVLAALLALLDGEHALAKVPERQPFTVQDVYLFAGVELSRLALDLLNKAVEQGYLLERRGLNAKSKGNVAVAWATYCRKTGRPWVATSAPSGRAEVFLLMPGGKRLSRAGVEQLRELLRGVALPDTVPSLPVPEMGGSAFVDNDLEAEALADALLHLALEHGEAS
jgi:hypothetical protein